MENGEWRIENGEWRMENGKIGMVGRFGKLRIIQNNSE